MLPRGVRKGSPSAGIILWIGSIKLWIFRTGSVVTERFRNTDLHNEGTRKKLGEINPAKSPANSTFKWRHYLERAKGVWKSRETMIHLVQILRRTQVVLSLERRSENK